MAYRRGSFAIFLRVLSAQAVGVLCAAFYLLPAFAAQGTIRSTHELAFHVRTLFVSRTLQDLTLSADACAIGCLILYCIWRRRRPVARGPAYIMVLIGLIGLFFQMPFTHWLWLHAPELYIVGFPHRFQVFLAMALPFAVLAGRTDRRFPLAVLAASLALTAIPFYSIMTWVHRDGPLETGQQKVQAAQAGYPGRAGVPAARHGRRVDRSVQPDRRREPAAAAGRERRLLPDGDRVAAAAAGLRRAGNRVHRAAQTLPAPFLALHAGWQAGDRDR